MGRVGIEWVSEYHQKGDELPNAQAQAEGFYNTLNATRHYNVGDDSAHDVDFEQQGVGNPPAGTDDQWVETVDIVYFAGHGTPDYFLFGTSSDDGKAIPTEMRWGDGLLKWVVLDACNVLFNNPKSPNTAIARWGQVFAGLHYILGFHTATDDEVYRGGIFAQYLNQGDTIRDAWVKACQDTESNNTVWAYLRADGRGTSTANDHWIGAGAVAADPRPVKKIHHVKGAC